MLRDSNNKLEKAHSLLYNIQAINDAQLAIKKNKLTTK